MRNLRTANSDALAVTAAEKIELLQAAIERVIRGKPDAVRLAIVTLLAGGHLLIEDVPGVGKTTLAHALSRALDCSFQRIQFTSDLLPSDVIGLSVYNQVDALFEWKPGPIFANIILADEINRTTPKTQSALLEAMAEAHVTVEGVTHGLPTPFMVLATQITARIPCRNHSSNVLCCACVLAIRERWMKSKFCATASMLSRSTTWRR